MIIEMRALWLVENYVISCYNHQARGDYNTEALIFKMAATRFLDEFEEETSKIKGNVVDNRLSNCTKTIILLRLVEYFRIIPSRGLFDIIIPPLRHFTILGQNNGQNMPRYYTVEQGKNTDWRGATKWPHKTNRTLPCFIRPLTLTF